MAVEIKYTPDFEKELKHLAKKYPSIYKDLANLLDALEKNPETGSPLGNKYKVSTSSRLEKMTIESYRLLKKARADYMFI